MLLFEPSVSRSFARGQQSYIGTKGRRLKELSDAQPAYIKARELKDESGTNELLKGKKADIDKRTRAHSREQSNSLQIIRDPSSTWKI